MFKRKFEKAVADWPKTAMTKDGGVHVTGKYVQPLLAWRAGMIAAFIGIIAAVDLWSRGMPGPGFALLIFLAIVWPLFLRASVYELFGKNVDVKIYPDRIALPGWFGYKNYSRAMPIEFRIEQHHKALAETGQYRIFRAAIEAVMQYGEKRIPLAEMPEKDMELARALIIRLQNVCHSVDAAMKMGANSRTARRAPAGDFGPAPDIR